MLLKEAEEAPYVSSKPRQSTNVGFIVLQALFYLVWIILVGYSSAYSDWRRLNGYDDDGDICGIKNVPQAISPGSGKDLTEKKILKLMFVNGELFKTCVEENCDNGKCELSAFTILSYVEKATEVGLPITLAVGVVVAGLSVLYMFFLRHATAFCVWFVIIAVPVLIEGAAIFMWLNFGATGFGLIYTIIAAVIVIFFIVVRRKIRLSILMLKEAGKAIFATKTILFQPILSSIVSISFTSLFIYLGLIVITAGELKEVFGRKYEYAPDGAIIAARFMCLLAFLWLCTFVYSCQYMVVSGAVSRWFFIRNKTNLKSPVFSSFKTLVKYHLGTASVGSMLMAIIKLLSLVRSRLCYFSCLRNLLQRLTVNAFVITAMRGEPFFQAGIKACKLLQGSVVKAIVVYIISSMVLGCGLVFLFLIVFIPTTLITAQYNEEIIPVQIVITVAVILIITVNYLVLYESAVDTIILCLCEDQEIHKDEPHKCYMSDSLKKFFSFISNDGLHVSKEGAYQIA